jgi:hypothetical protein
MDTIRAPHCSRCNSEHDLTDVAGDIAICPRCNKESPQSNMPDGDVDWQCISCLNNTPCCDPECIEENHTHTHAQVSEDNAQFISRGVRVINAILQLRSLENHKDTIQAPECSQCHERKDSVKITNFGNGFDLYCCDDCKC